jgi:hypothetical protein
MAFSTVWSGRARDRPVFLDHGDDLVEVSVARLRRLMPDALGTSWFLPDYRYPPPRILISSRPDLTRLEADTSCSVSAGLGR